jgi:hypothetical protein
MFSSHWKLMVAEEYKTLKAKGVKFYGKPEVQAWGVDVVLEDLYGNLFDLVQRFTH